MKLLFVTYALIMSCSIFAQEENHHTLRKNSIYAEGLGYSLFFGSLNYERNIRLTDHTYLGIRGGIAFSYGVHGIVELNGFFFGPKHFLETGIGTCSLSGWHFSDEPDGSYFKFSSLQPAGRIGYRYQGTIGFLVKAAPFIFHDGDKLRVWPSVSIGYSF